MTDPEHLAEVCRWLEYAEDDLRAGRTLAGDCAVAPRQVCWLAQQATEKALKAALTFEQTDFPRTHNLDALRGLLSPRWGVRQGHPDLAELTGWAIEARYPGDWPEATKEDACRALEQAERVVKSVRGDLILRLEK
jgi:HEPN domain-containing protein